MFDVSEYDSVKRGFCKSSLESFPIGDGDCGANVWLESDGIIRVLLSKTDSYTESFILAKAGLIELCCVPSPFSADNPPVIKLSMIDGGITIADTLGKCNIRIAAFRKTSVLGISAAFDEKTRISARINRYRSRERVISKSNPSAYSYLNAPFEVKESADELVYGDSYITSYHRNQWSYVDFTRKNQHLTSLPDIIKGRIFGFSAFSVHGKCADGEYTTEQALRTELYIASDCSMNTPPDEFVASLYKKCKEYSDIGFDALLQRNSSYWKSYFGDYFIHFSGCKEAETVAAGCVYQKYMLGCVNAGKMPIKFNGSIFTVHPNPDDNTDYDYRKWGSPFWIQNTRLIYWAMLFGGDFEGMKPFFDFCFSVIPVCRERARVLFGTDGIYLQETVCPDGSFADGNFGYDNADSEKPACKNRYIGKHFNGALEISYMMLKYLEYSGDKAYFEKTCLPFISGVIEFFSGNFKRVNGKIYFSGVSSLETWQDCENDTPDIAGISAVVNGLADAGYPCIISKDELPDLPYEQRDGVTVIAPCGKYIETTPKNRENPELYTVFPFDTFTFRSPEAQRKTAELTYEKARYRHIHGWSQMPIFASLLGRREDVGRMLYENFSQKADGCFFGAYYGPNFDWTPDQDHGCSNLIAAMLSCVRSADGETVTRRTLPDGWKVTARLPVPGGMKEI